MNFARKEILKFTIKSIKSLRIIKSQYIDLGMLLNDLL